MGSRMVLAGTFAGLVVGLGTGWLLGKLQADQARREGDESRRQSEAQIADLETRTRQHLEDSDRTRDAATAAERRVRDLEGKADAAASEAAALSEKLAAAEAEVARLSPSAPEPKRSGPAFRFEEFGDTFDRVDWDSVALHTTAIVGPIKEIADALRAGEPVPLQAAGEAQKHNGPLIQAVSRLGGKLSGTGPNGAYTHPAFQVNALAAALAQIGLPLSAAQRTSLEDLGRRFTEEERKRVASYDDTTFQLRKIVQEGALKDRFFDAVRGVLTATQLDALSPAATRDRMAADLWSEGLLWATLTRPIPYDKPETVTDAVSRALGPNFKLDDAGRAKVAAITADWVARLPESITAHETDALDRIGMLPADLVAVGAEQMLALVERIVTELALSGDQLAAARRWSIVLMPVPGSGSDGDGPH